MKCFAYLSHAAGAETETSLAELAQGCRTFNAQVGVTGVLTYVEGRFAQLVEGPRDGVDEVIARINASRRHRDITALGETVVASRAFAGQPMLWRPAGVAEELERISRDPDLTRLQADLVTRILLFTRWEGGVVNGER
jgi:blue light- and temperature-responsive anti-repressor